MWGLWWREGERGFEGTLRVLSRARCCFINLVYFCGCGPQSPQRGVSSGLLTHGPCPRALILTVCANKYKHAHSCTSAHTEHIHLLWSFTFSPSRADFSAWHAVEELRGDRWQTLRSITQRWTATQLRKEDVIATKTKDNTSIPSKWMTSLHRANVIIKLQRWNKRGVEELKCAGVPY